MYLQKGISILKITDEKSRIRIHFIIKGAVRIRGSASASGSVGTKMSRIRNTERKPRKRLSSFAQIAQLPKETPEEASIDDGARLVVEAIPPHPPLHLPRPLQLRAHKSSDLKGQ